MAASINVKPGYKALVFDLDDTLFDTTRYCLTPALQNAFEVMIGAGLNTTIAACFEERAKFHAASPRGDFFAHLVETFGARDDARTTQKALLDAGKKAFYVREVEKDIFVFARVKETLADLSSRYLLFLVTMGDPGTQRQKVRNLGIQAFFQQVFYVDSTRGQKKSEAFGAILHTTGLKPEQVLCIGNRLDLEIAQGKQLGFDTCLVQTGEHKDVTPVSAAEHPDYKIASISEIIEVCQL